MLAAILSAIVPLLFKFVQDWITKEDDHRVIEVMEEVSNAQANAGDAGDALRAGKF